MQTYAGEAVASLFWDSGAIILVEFLERVATVSLELYVQTLRKFQQRTRRALSNGKMTQQCVISGLRLEVDEDCALLGCCAACSGNSLPKFWDSLSVPSSRVLSRNVGKE